MEGKTKNHLEDNTGDFMISIMGKISQMQKAQSVKEKTEITLKFKTSVEQRIITKKVQR